MTERYRQRLRKADAKVVIIPEISTQNII